MREIAGVVLPLTCCNEEAPEPMHKGKKCEPFLARSLSGTEAERERVLGSSSLACKDTGVTRSESILSSFAIRHGSFLLPKLRSRSHDPLYVVYVQGPIRTGTW